MQLGSMSYDDQHTECCILKQLNSSLPFLCLIREICSFTFYKRVSSPPFPLLSLYLRKHKLLLLLLLLLSINHIVGACGAPPTIEWERMVRALSPERPLYTVIMRRLWRLCY